MTKVCTTCRKSKLSTSKYFVRNKRIKGGLHYSCKECDKLRRQSPKFKEQNNRSVARYRSTLEGFLKSAVLSSKNSSKKYKIPHNIKYEYLSNLWETQEGKCALTGKSMTHLKKKGQLKSNCSIDQISPRQGYVEGNVQLVQYRYNRVKNDLTMEELLAFCETFLILHKRKEP